MTDYTLNSILVLLGTGYLFGLFHLMTDAYKDYKNPNIISNSSLLKQLKWHHWAQLMLAMPFIPLIYLFAKTK